MLKKKYTGGGSSLPPDVAGGVPVMTRVVAHEAANDESLRRLRNHARRMRRHGRAARAQVRRARGWTVGLW